MMGSSIAWQLARQIKQQQGVDGLQAPRNVEITLIDSGRFGEGAVLSGSKAVVSCFVIKNRGYRCVVFIVEFSFC